MTTVREGLAPRAVLAALARAAGSVEVTASGWGVAGAAAADRVDELTDALYAGWYTRPSGAGRPAAARGDPELYRSLLVPALRAAHAGAAIETVPRPVLAAAPTGTLLVALPPGSAGDASAARADIRRPGDYVAEQAPGVPVAAGARVRATARHDHHDTERGLWWCFTPEPPTAPLGRLYLDARAATAPRVVHAVTEVLLGAGVLFQLKCAAHANGFGRVDAVVVYHERDRREELLAALTTRADELGRLLDPEVPELTCPVLPGLSWADEDDPADDPDPGRDDHEHDHGPDHTLGSEGPERAARQSYGESRCRALAVALHTSRPAWAAAGPTARVEILAAGLAAARIDPTAPWRARTT
jgi:hypothetical protein